MRLATNPELFASKVFSTRYYKYGKWDFKDHVLIMLRMEKYFEENGIRGSEQIKRSGHPRLVVPSSRSKSRSRSRVIELLKTDKLEPESLSSSNKISALPSEEGEDQMVWGGSKIHSWIINVMFGLVSEKEPYS